MRTVGPCMTGSWRARSIRERGWHPDPACRRIGGGTADATSRTPDAVGRAPWKRADKLGRNCRCVDRSSQPPSRWRSSWPPWLPRLAGGTRSVRFSGSDHYTVAHPCGVVEDTRRHRSGDRVLRWSGAWIRDLVVFAYDGVYTGPSGSLANKTSPDGRIHPRDRHPARARHVHPRWSHRRAGLRRRSSRLRHERWLDALRDAEGDPLEDPAAMEALDEALCALLS